MPHPPLPISVASSAEMGAEPERTTMQPGGPPAMIWRLSSSPCGLSVLLATSVVALSWVFGDKVFVGLSAFLLILIRAAIIAARWVANSPGLRTQWSLRQLLLVVTCIAVVFSTLAQQWPFRLRFALSRSALESLASRIEQGGTPAKWEIAGLFWVRLAEVRERGGQRYTCLWTDPIGCSGFVRLRPNQARYDFNLWSEVRLNDDQWQFVVED
jgi:hypothetical protein